MSQTTQCRLCLQTGADQKQLYNESGELNMEIFNKMKTFFNPKFLNIHTAICLQCWQRCSSFYEFLLNLTHNQCNINEEQLQNKQAHQVKTLISEYDTDDSQPSVTLDIKAEISTEDYMVSESVIHEGTTVAKSNNKRLAKARQTIRSLNEIISKWKSNLECGVCQKSHADFSILKQHFGLEHPNIKAHILCCKLKLSLRADIADHAAFHKDPKAFKCHRCDEYFQSGRKLYQHIRRHRYIEKKCAVCKKQFSSAFLLREHMLCHTPLKLYKCPTCSLTYQYVQSLKQHLQLKHPESWSEEMKGRSFYVSNRVVSENNASEVKILRSARDCEEIIAQWKSNLECGVCQKSYADFIILKQHFSLEHPYVKPYIVCCKDKLTSRSDIADHAAFHMDPKAFKCHKCDRCFQGGRQLYQHIKHSHNRKGKKCAICKKQFSSAFLLREHMLCHRRPKLYKCPGCLLTSKYFKSIRTHLQLKHPELWSEEMRERSFYDSNLVVTGIKGNKVKLQRTAKDCDEIIAQCKSNLECGICQKSQTNYLALKEHFSREHANEKAHILCCQRKLLSRVAIADHVQFHMNPESFKCHKCGKCFPGLAPLRKHMEDHNDQTYKCVSCERTYNLRNSLQTHLRVVHPEVWSERGSIPNFYESMQITTEAVPPNDIEYCRTTHDIENIISQWRASLECGICQKPHNNFSDLKKHFCLEHAKEKAYILCCDRKLTSRYQVADHARWHLYPDAFKCQECGSCYINKYILKKHIRSKHQ